MKKPFQYQAQLKCDCQLIKEFYSCQQPLKILNTFNYNYKNIKYNSFIFLDLLPISSGNHAETRQFLDKIVQILFDFLHETYDRSAKVLDFHHPEQLLEMLDLSLPNKAQNLDQLIADCKDTLKYQVKTG